MYSFNYGNAKAQNTHGRIRMYMCECVWMCCVSAHAICMYKYSEYMCQHIPVRFIHVCFSLGCVSEHVNILAHAHKYVAYVNVCTLGKKSKCKNLEGMPIIFVIMWICMKLSYVIEHNMSCVYVWVCTYTCVYVWRCCIFLWTKQYLDVCLSMWTCQRMPLCLCVNVCECVVCMSAHACECGHMQLCEHLETCLNV